MRKKMSAVVAWMRAKPLFAAALVVIVCQVASLSARSPVSAVPSDLTSPAPVKVQEKPAGREAPDGRQVEAPAQQLLGVVGRLLGADVVAGEDGQGLIGEILPESPRSVGVLGRCGKSRPDGRADDGEADGSGERSVHDGPSCRGGHAFQIVISEERRVGKKCVSSC